MRRLLPLVGAFYALLAAHPASAEATGRVFTCQQSATLSWQMIQPQEHADAGHFPRWADCEAWRNGDPGPSYVWSYGLETSTTTTSTVPETTTTEATTTTVPETTTTIETTTTTTEPATTTTSSTTTTTSSTTTSSSSTVPAETTTTTEATTTTTITPNITPTPEPPQTRPDAPQLAPGASNALAPGVTPEAQRAIVAAALGVITSSAASNRKKT
jgi:hypothetical protein